MKKRGFLSLFVVAFLTLAVGTLHSCKDTDDELYADLQMQILESNSTLKDVIAAQNDRLNELATELEEHKTAAEKEREELQKKLDEYLTKAEAEKTYATLKDLENCLAQISKLDAKIAVINADIDKIKESLKKLDEHDASIADLYKQINDLKLLYDEVKNGLAALDIRVTNVEDKVEFLCPKVIAMSDSLSKVYGRAEANSKTIEEYGKRLEGMETTDSLLSHRVDSLYGISAGMLDSLQATRDSMAALYDDAKKYADDAVKVVADQVKDLETQLGEMKDAFDAANDAVEKFDELLVEVGKYSEKIAANTERIGKLNEKFVDVFNKQITSVIAQGAYSPVLGYFALPTGLKSQILAAYYGESLNDVVFPSTNTIPYLNADNAFTAAEKDLLGFEDELDNVAPTWHSGNLLLGGQGNAGTLYMTVNPNTANLSQTSFKLVNSAGDDACVSFLDGAKKSSHRLSFGYTRSGSNNGFYEMEATVTESQVAGARLRVNFDNIKNAVKDVLTYDDGVDLDKVISTLYNEIEDIADANAIEATWTDSLGEHSTYSGYDVAAVAVKPLSYNFMKDFHLDSFWGMDKAYQLVDNIMSKLYGIDLDLPQFDMSNLPQIDTIVLEDLSEDLLGKFVLSLDTVIRDTFSLDTLLVISDTIPIDSVSIPDMEVPVPGQEIKVPIDIKVPSQSDSIWNPAKPHKGETGADNEIYKDMPDSVLITLPETSIKDTIKVTVDGDTVKVVGQKIAIDSVKVEFKQRLKFEFPVEIKFSKTVDMRPAVEELYGNVTGSITDVNKMLKDLQTFINKDLKDMLDQINNMGPNMQNKLDSIVGSIDSELKGFLGKLDGKLCDLVNSVHSKLQPAMFIKTVDGMATVSGSKMYPSSVSGSFVISPTSYTMELLAPAFKKYVAVTDVFDTNTGKSAKGGDVNCINILKKVNSQNEVNGLHKVVEGGTRGIKIENFKSGYTYEITYSAMDYTGIISNTKYYVKMQ